MHLIGSGEHLVDCPITAAEPLSQIEARLSHERRLLEPPLIAYAAELSGVDAAFHHLELLLLLCGLEQHSGVARHGHDGLIERYQGGRGSA